MSRIAEKDTDFYKLTAYKQRESYISTISHDLKIPIIAQMRALELLSNESLGKLNSEQKEMIDLTLESCKSIYEMLGAILTSYKYENREMLLTRETINIEKILNDILFDCKNLIISKEININVEINNFSPFADEEKLKKSFRSIIEYSLNSAQNNSVLKIKTQKFNNNFQFIIAFYPIYNSINKFKTIFENYKNPIENLDKIGCNLNLYLAKQIIEAHNGFITFKNIDKKLLIIINLLNNNL